MKPSRCWRVIHKMTRFLHWTDPCWIHAIGVIQKKSQRHMQCCLFQQTTVKQIERGCVSTIRIFLSKSIVTNMLSQRQVWRCEFESHTSSLWNCFEGLCCSQLLIEVSLETLYGIYTAKASENMFFAPRHFILQQGRVRTIWAFPAKSFTEPSAWPVRITCSLALAMSPSCDISKWATWTNTLTWHNPYHPWDWYIYPHLII